ncbi:MAG: hypothetical protein WA789_15130, partial [Candidatus Acidiferrum sp.]
LDSAAFAGALLFASFSGARQTQTSAAQTYTSYDLSRETVIQGTVVSYTAASQIAPIGPHARIDTSSGAVDVHLGNAALMKASGMDLESGDSVKIVGELEDFGNGNVFIARVLQKGNQVITLRNSKGIPILGKPAATAKPRSILGGAR